MRDPQLEYDFPKLRAGNYSIQSPEDINYNCVAFAVGNETRVWQWMPRPTGGYYWPPGIDGDDSINDWIKVFELHGYRICDSGTFERGREKIALYVDSEDHPSHVAKQEITMRRWKSKLGIRGHDIDHDSHSLLEGFNRDEYGIAKVFMSRPYRGEGQSLWFRLRSFLARLISPT